VLGGFLSLVGGLVQRVETLEARAAALERRLDRLDGERDGGRDGELSAARPGGSAPPP